MTDYNTGRAQNEGGGAEAGSFFKKVNTMGQGANKGQPQVSKSEKNKTLLALLLALGILQTLYMNLAAFFPIVAEKEYELTPLQTALVLTMFQVAYLICAPIVGQTLQKVGRKNMILMGYMLCTGATVAFGICYHIPKEQQEIGKDKDNKPIYEQLQGGQGTLFFALSVAIRFIQGIGDSMVSTASYSVVSIEFPH